MGPNTFILEVTEEVPRRLSHPSRRTIGLRVPGHRVMQELLALFGDQTSDLAIERQLCGAQSHEEEARYGSAATGRILKQRSFARTLATTVSPRPNFDNMAETMRSRAAGHRPHPLHYGDPVAEEMPAQWTTCSLDIRLWSDL